MKRFTLFFFSAVAALCSFAQSVGEHGESIGKYGAIYQMPEGAPTRIYNVMGTKAVYAAADEEQGAEAGVYTLDVVRSIEVVEFEDGTMFFKDLVTDAAYGSYVKGNRAYDNELDMEIVRIPVGQVLAHSNSTDLNIVLMRFLFAESETGMDLINCMDDILFAVEKYGENETLTQMNDQMGYNFYGAMLVDEKNSIVHLGDAAIVMTYTVSEGENDELLEMPAGVPTKTYNCHAYSYAQSEAYSTDKYVDYDVEIARVGDDVYLKGLYFYQNPDAVNPISNVIKGKWVNGEVIFPQHQYIGIDGRGASIYVVAMGTTEDGYYFEARDNWTLLYDAENDTYDGCESIVRFNPVSFYEPGTYSYDSIDEIFLTYKNSNGIVAVEGGVKADTIYDLQGRKVKTAQKGLFIMDGKKVVR